MDIPSIGKPKLIGLAGPRKAGKDTVGLHLTMVFGFKPLAFADPIKRGLAYMFDIPIEVFYDEVAKEQPHPNLNGRTPRHAMETLGTEWAQGVLGSSIWADVVHRQIMDLTYGGDRLVVVTDVRFPHEVAMLKGLGGHIWEVHGRGPGYDDTHPSRRRLPEDCFSAQIKNNHTLGMLHAQVGVEIARIDRGY